MKAILEFDIPDDQADFQIACDGQRWMRIVLELNEYLRKTFKYDDPKKIKADILEEIKGVLLEYLNDEGLRTDTEDGRWKRKLLYG